MQTDLYNSNDEGYKKVIKLLQGLPQEKAPDNFEYNLNVRISNKQFNIERDEFNTFIPWRYIIPASGTLVIAILLMTGIFSDPENFDNPFQTQPKMRSELSGNLVNSKQNYTLSDNSRINENDVVIKEKNVVENKISDNEYQKKFYSTGKVASAFPFNESNSTNLDEVISEQQTVTLNSKASLVGGSAPRNSFFEGFFIREEIDKTEFEALKARNDSLIRVLQNNRNMLNKR